MDIEQLARTKPGNYEIEFLLGRGMSVVYKAEHTRLKICLLSFISYSEIVDAIFQSPTGKLET